jgi:hypothetical protein
MKALIFAGLISLATQAAPAQDINGRDPVLFAKALSEMGYSPTAAKASDEIPMFNAEISGTDTTFAFGGCVGGKDCTYVLLVSSFTDVANPPAEWINRINRDYDLGKLWINEDKNISFSLMIPMGVELIPRGTLRFSIEQWSAYISAVAASARDEKLVK